MLRRRLQQLTPTRNATNLCGHRVEWHQRARNRHRDAVGALLGGADVVAYPSSAEGFGLPVLEAMACGAAVLTTRRLALPEVGGDAVEYTEPTEDAIAATLTALLAAPERRATLGARARARVPRAVGVGARRQALRGAMGPVCCP